MKKTLVLLSVFAALAALSFSAAVAQAKTLSLTSGTGQIDTVGATLQLPFIVTVADEFGSPVSGVLVEFAIVSAPIGASGQSLSDPTVSTDANGQARTQFTLGNRPGDYTVHATSAGLEGSPVTFGSRATIGPARNISMTSGNGQIGQVATALANPFVVTVTDRYGNPVPGRTVTWGVAVTPPGAVGQSLSSVSTSTDDNGRASSILTLGTKRGAYEVTASAPNLNGNPVTFTSTATPGPPTQVRIETQLDGNGTVVPPQSVQSGSSITVYSITRDQYDNFVAYQIPDSWSMIDTTLGVRNTDLVPQGSGRRATFTGHLVGTGKIRASIAGLTEVVSGTITVTPGAATRILVETNADGSGVVVPEQSLAAGGSITAYAISRDALNNFVANIPGTWSLVNKNGFVVDGDLVPSGDARSATFTGHGTGSAQLRATSGGLAATNSGTITVSAGTVAKINVETRADGTGTVVPDQNLLASRSITVYAISRDAADNFIANVSATAWSLQNVVPNVADSDLVVAPDKKSAAFTGHRPGSAKLQATLTGLTPTASGTITVVPGTPARIRVETTPDGTGTLVPAQTILASRSITVYAISRDSVNNFVANVAASIWSMQNESGGVADSDLVASPDKKSALFTAHKIGSGQIRATLPPLSPVLSELITVGVGTPARVRVETRADGTGTIVPDTVVLSGDSLRVYAVTRDSSDNFIANVAADAWTLPVRTGGVLETDLRVVPGGRSAWFRGRALGTARIQATSGSLALVPSGLLTVTVGTASRLVFYQEPSAVVSGTVMTPPVIVRIEDINGNHVTSDTRNVTLALLENPTGATLGGTTTVGAVGGIATFNNLTVDKADSHYTLRASSVPALQMDTSTTFIVEPGLLTGFTIEAAAGGPIPVQSAGVPFDVRITARDQAGNVVRSFAGTANVSANVQGVLETGEGTTLAFTNGVLAAHTVSFAKMGTFSLAVRNTVGFESGMSNTFEVAAGAPAQVAFIQQPTHGVAGSALTPAITVQLQDALGNNVAQNNVEITLELLYGTGTLSGTTSGVTNLAGLVSFNNLRIDSAGTKQLRARSGSLTEAASDSFVISPGAPSKLAFVVNPGMSTAGAPLTTQPVVALQDQFGNTVTGASETVTLDIQTNPSSGTLSGTRTMPIDLQSGLVQFTDLSIDKAGIGYTLTATGLAVSTSPGSVVSTPFDITSGVPVKLAFTVQPTDAVAGAILNPAVVVQIQDGLGNLVDIHDTPIALSMDSPGSLGGNIVRSTIGGSAVFNDLTVDKEGAKVLRASGGGLLEAQSNAFTISPAQAAKLAFTTQPGGGVAGQALSTQPVITLRDQFGNTVTGTAQQVTISLKDTAGPNATLGGVTTEAVNPTTGQAVFTNLSIDKAGVGYTLTAVGSSVDTARDVVVSEPLTVVAGTPAHLHLETMADGKGSALVTQNVSSSVPISIYAIARDNFGNFTENVAADEWGLVEMAGGAEVNDLVPAADRKSAVFTGGAIGSSARIIARAPGLTPDTSGILSVVQPGAPTKILVETAPNGTGTVVPAQSIVSGGSITVYAVERDAANNFVANIPADSWSLQVASGEILPADLAPSSDKRSAVFTARRVGKARIGAAVGTLTQVMSDTIRVLPGTPASVAVQSKSPDSARVDTYFSSSLVSIVRDSAGNPVRNVVVTYSAPPSGPSSRFDDGVFTATTDSLGLATSRPIKANTVIGQYSDTARVSGIATPALFVLRNLPGAAATITAVTGTPQITEVSTAFPIPLAVAVRDTFGNAVDSVLVTFTQPSSGPSGTFAGGVNVAYTNRQGIATSAVFVANILAGTYTVQAAVSGIVTPATFTLTNSAGTAGSVAAVAGTSPQAAQVTTSYSTRFQALVKDGAGNAVQNVLVRFTAPSSGPSGSFPGGLTDTARTNASGIATASVFTADSVAGSYNILATVDGIASAAVFALTNLPGPVDSFFVEAESGGEIATQIARRPFAIRITAKDMYNNIASGFNSTVTITSTGALLSGGGKTVSFVAGVLDSHAVVFSRAADTTYTLTATRTGGAESGKSNGFPVINPTPTVRSITPSNGIAGQELNVTILGSGFIGGVTAVTFGDQITTKSTLVTSDTTMVVTINISATAALGSRTVAVLNSPPGGGFATVVGGFTVGDNPRPTVTRITPDSVAQLQSVRVTLHGTNFLGGGVSTVSFVPPAGIALDTVKVDSSTGISLWLTISALAQVGPHDIIVRNAPPGGGADTLDDGFIVTKSDIAVPSLLSPLNGATRQPSTLTLSWQSAFGATSYDVQVSTTATFSSGLVVFDSLLTGTNRQIGPLTMATSYYWRVRSRNNNGVSAWSVAWSFDNVSQYPGTYTLNDTVDFPVHENIGEYTASDYQMVGLPGAGKAKLSTLIPGSPGTDWQAYWDNGGQGAASSYFIVYNESDETFTCAAGRAFWLIKKGPWVISNQVVNTEPLQASTNAVHVKLHSGWNLLTNPFTGNLRWSHVQTANDNFPQPLWGWISDIGGARLFAVQSEMKPYIGYYVYNNPASPIDTLKFPFGSSLGKSAAMAEAAADSDAWSVGVDLIAGKYQDRSTTLGVSALAAQGKDKLDFNKPRPFADVPSVCFARPEWDSYSSSFASDIRAPFSTIEAWELTVSTAGPKSGSVDLSFRGLEAVPQEFGVYLVDEAGASYRDLRQHGPRYRFVPPAPLAKFKLLVGTREALDEEVAKTLPRAFALDQNYPNPFNPSTTIPVSVPYRADVTLKIYNIIGEEVATLYSGVLEQGRHRFTWEGRNNSGLPVASGAYFIRLTSISGPRFVGKMLLMR